MLFFFPAKIQVVAGVVLAVVGLTLLHSFILAGFGLAGVAFGTTRYVRSRRASGLQR